jgi:type III pantothenate kinase
MKAAPVIRLRWHRHLPVRFLYEKPETLGADRIADALYAHARCPARNVIVIDSGTAITVDAVSSPGTYTGGVILAGVAAQLAGLRASAGTLPAVPMPAGKVPLPGRSTVRCMQAGAAHGTAGALNHLVKEYRRLMGGKCVVLATGGAWHLTQKLVDFDSTEVPDMTLIGMGIYTLYPNKSP